MGKLLICGATGFIGRNLVEYFAAYSDHEVYGVYRQSPPFEVPGVRWLQADLRNPEAVHTLLQGVDVLIQAAATTSGAKDIVQRPYYHVTDNAVMNSLLFRAAYEHNIRQVVFFSCTVMYASSDRPLKETDFDANAALYKNYFGVGWTKIYLEKMGEFYARLGGPKFTVIRHSNIYGPHDKYDLERSHVFGATMTKVMTNTTGRVVIWGKGTEKRDLLHVDDLCCFVALALRNQKAPFALYNAGRGVAVSVRDLVDAIIRHSGRRLAVEHDLSKPTLDTALCLDCTKAKTELGWTPAITLDEGISRVMAWYRQTILKETLP